MARYHNIPYPCNIYLIVTVFPIHTHYTYTKYAMDCSRNILFNKNLSPVSRPDTIVSHINVTFYFIEPDLSLYKHYIQNTADFCYIPFKKKNNNKKWDILLQPNFTAGISIPSSFPSNHLWHGTLSADSKLKLIHSVQLNKIILLGASNASFKDGQSSHAWILSSGNVGDITDSTMNTSGLGPVGGLSSYIIQLQLVLWTNSNIHYD